MRSSRCKKLDKNVVGKIKRMVRITLQERIFAEVEKLCEISSVL